MVQLYQRSNWRPMEKRNFSQRCPSIGLFPRWLRWPHVQLQPRSPSSANFSLQIKFDGEGPSLSSWLWTEAFIDLLCVSMGKTKLYLNNKKWKSFPGQTVSSVPWLAEQNVDIKCNCFFFFPAAKNVSLDLPRHSDWLMTDINPSCPTQSFFDLLSGGERQGFAFIFLVPAPRSQ